MREEGIIRDGGLKGIEVRKVNIGEMAVCRIWVLCESSEGSSYGDWEMIANLFLVENVFDYVRRWWWWWWWRWGWRWRAMMFECRGGKWEGRGQWGWFRGR